MKNLFFINSPFQLLCSIEAISDFKIKNNILVIFNKGAGKNYQQIGNLLNEYQFKFDKIEFIDRKLRSINGWLKGFYSVEKLLIDYSEINNLFIGDYNSGIVRHYANSVSYKKLYLVDDGFATIDIYKRLKKGRFYNTKDYIKFLLSKGRYRFKSVEDVCYYTIFDNYINDKCVFKNELKNLVLDDEWIDKDIIYWIGTPNVEDGILEKNFYLDSIGKWLKKLQTEVIYFPHRRESKEKLQELNEKFEIRINEIDLPIELYIINSKIRPRYVISFFSTALYSLNRLLDTTEIFYIRIPDENILSRKDHIRDIYNILEKEIKSINQED